jgi:hypothetical protein
MSDEAPARNGGCAARTTRSTRSERRRSALAAETLPLPRAGEHQEALRVLLLARRNAVDIRRRALVQLRSVIVTAPEKLRDELRRPRRLDPTEFLDVDVDQLARPRALIADRLLETDPAKRPIPARVSTTETVESGIRSVSAISAAVIRNRRKAMIVATRSVGVRLAIRLGAEERSKSPCSPSARKRAPTCGRSER